MNRPSRALAGVVAVCASFAACDGSTPVVSRHEPPAVPRPFSVSDDVLSLDLTGVAEFGPVSSPNAIAYSPDGDRLVVPDYHADRVRIYDGRTFELVEVLDSLGNVEGVAYTPQGRHLIVAAKSRPWATVIFSTDGLRTAGEVSHRGGYVIPHPDGLTFYKSSYNDEDVLRVGIDGRILSRFTLPEAWGAAHDADDRLLYVTSGPRGARSLYVLGEDLFPEVIVELDWPGYLVLPLQPRGHALVLTCEEGTVRAVTVDVVGGRALGTQEVASADYPCHWGFFGWGSPWAQVSPDAAIVNMLLGLLAVDLRTGRVHVVDGWPGEDRPPCCEVAYDPVRSRLALAGTSSETVQVFDLRLEWVR